MQSQVDPLATRLIEDGQVVGMVVGIVRGDEVEFLVYGETKKDSGQAPGKDTVYEIGSITKVFTGVLLADAIRSGKVELDDPLQQHLPDGVKVPVIDDEAITLLHLTTHTSGLPRMPGNFRPADPDQPYVDYDRKKMLSQLAEVKLSRTPGTYEYSNYAVGLLGEVLADGWKQPYEKVLVERIFKPLELNDTRMTLSDSMRERFAPGYNSALKEVPGWDFEAFAGAGAVRSTAADMVKFIQANLADEDTPISHVLHDAQQIQPTPADGQRMALGWHLAGDGITRWHNGMTGGYHSWLAIIPDRNVGVVVLSNTATMKVTHFGEQVTRIAAGESVKPSPRRREVEVDTDVLEKYVGVYRLAPQFELTVTLEDGHLMVQATGQPKAQVYAESPTKFFYKIVDAQITFIPSKDGVAEKLILHQLGRNMEAPRRE